MEREISIVCLIFVLLAYEFREISAATKCFECGTTFTPYCEDPIFPKASITYHPTVCTSLMTDDKFASKVVTEFLIYMTDDTEEMTGTNSVAGESELRRRRRSIAVSWLDRIAPAFHITQRSKRQILNSLPGNWSFRAEGEVDPPPEEGKPDEEEGADGGAEKDTASLEGENDEFQCYKIVFANQRDELEEFRGCVNPALFDVCELFINYNEKSMQRVVFCELCKQALTDKDHPACNDATRVNCYLERPLFVALSLLFIFLSLHGTVQVFDSVGV